MYLDHIKALEKSTYLKDENEIRRCDPVVLAFIGDTLYDLYVRTRLAHEKNSRAGKLHMQAVNFVRAKGQADALLRIQDRLDDEEQTIVRRARNAKGATPPKNCDPAVYHRATSFEALLGYLYLMRRQDRLIELVDAAFEGNKRGE